MLSGHLGGFQRQSDARRRDHAKRRARRRKQAGIDVIGHGVGDISGAAVGRSQPQRRLGLQLRLIGAGDVTLHGGLKTRGIDARVVFILLHHRHQRALAPYVGRFDRDRAVFAQLVFQMG